jgi:hypothetical protein
VTTDEAMAAEWRAGDTVVGTRYAVSRTRATHRGIGQRTETVAPESHLNLRERRAGGGLKFAGVELADMSTAVDDETILEVLRSNDAPRMTTTEVAGQLPITRGTTRTRLQRLVDDDLLHRKREGNNVVWWLPEREDELEAWEAEQAAAEAAESEESAADDGEEPSPTEEGAEADEAADAEEDTSVEVEATEQANAEDAETEVEVEAVDEDDETVTVETPDESTETRTAAERPELSDDEEGLRAVALAAAVLVVLLLLRKLLAGGGEETE